VGRVEIKLGGQLGKRFEHRGEFEVAFVSIPFAFAMLLSLDARTIVRVLI
jgi:hypothetical protein